MDRQRLGVLGSDCAGDFRVELAACASERQLDLELLHDEGTPTFAHVFRGRLNCSGFHVPVAVKLQRDQPLTKEQSQCVNAKFAIERDVFRRLQAGAESDGPDEGHVVRLFEVSAAVRAGGTVADEESLPPSIVCRHALHALQPRCPAAGCDGLLKADQWAANDEERRLLCEKCNRGYANTAETRDRLLTASVQKDLACARCPHRSGTTATCLASSRLLNFYPANVLLFELLDLDLEDYLVWQRLDTPPAGRLRSWERFRRQRRAALPLERLGEVIDLFGQTLAGVERLHERGIAHLDLKPHNLCLRFGAALRLKVIDLGLADDPQTLLYLRQAGGSRQLQTEYAASEVQEPRWPLPAIPYRADAERVLLTLTPVPLKAGDLFDPLVVPGDTIHLAAEGAVAGHQAATVEQTVIKSGALHVLARLRERWAGGKTEGRGTVVIDRACTRGADVFSLGMILIRLLLPEIDLKGFRPALTTLARVLQQPDSAAGSLTARGLVEFLRGGDSPHLAEFRTLEDRLTFYGEHAWLARELFGIALRCVLRGAEAGVYLKGRGGDAMQALKALRGDVEQVRRGFAFAAAAAVGRDCRADLVGRLAALRGWLDRNGSNVSPIASVRQPPYDRRLLEEHLALVAGTLDDREGARLLQLYGNRPAWLREHLDRLLAEVNAGGSGNGTPGPAVPSFDQRALLWMLRYALVHFDPTTLRRFQECWADPLGGVRAEEPKPAAIRTEAQTWKGRHRLLRARIERFNLVLDQVQFFTARLDALLFRRLQREKARGGPCRLRFHLGRKLRTLLCEAELLRELRWLREQVAALDDAFQKSLQDWTSALREWDGTTGPLRSALAVYANNASQQAVSFQLQYQGWRKEYALGAGRVEQFVREMIRSVLGVWDEAESGWSLRRLFRRRLPTVAVVLGEEPLELREALSPEKTLEQLRAISLGPQAVVEASLALSELQGIHARLSAPG